MNLICSAPKAGHQRSLSRRPQPQRELQGEANKSVCRRTAALRPRAAGGCGKAQAGALRRLALAANVPHHVQRTGRALGVCNWGFWSTRVSQPRLVCTYGCVYLPQEQGLVGGGLCFVCLSPGTAVSFLKTFL